LTVYDLQHLYPGLTASVLIEAAFQCRRKTARFTATGQPTVPLPGHTENRMPGPYAGSYYCGRPAGCPDQFAGHVAAVYRQAGRIPGSRLCLFNMFEQAYIYAHLAPRCTRGTRRQQAGTLKLFPLTGRE
jgi:hypothetical protein